MKIQKKALDIFAVLMICIALYFAFIFAPSEKVMGAIQRIFYFHVSSAWIAFFCFLRHIRVQYPVSSQAQLYL